MIVVVDEVVQCRRGSRSIDVVVKTEAIVVLVIGYKFLIALYIILFIVIPL